MNKKTILSFVLPGALVIILALVLFFQSSDNNQTDLKSLENQITYYYGESCPHCLNILQFIEENKIGEKVNFTKKEIFKDTVNSREFSKVIEKCGIKPADAGVPLVYAEGKCLVGEPDVKSFFKEKAGISQ